MYTHQIASQISILQPSISVSYFIYFIIKSEYFCQLYFEILPLKIARKMIVGKSNFLAKSTFAISRASTRLFIYNV